MTTDCIERCGSLALPGRPRCRACEQVRQARRNRSAKRQAYRDPVYLAQPTFGTCHLCGKPGANTRDHIVPIAEQMRRYGEVIDHRTLPAHRGCNSARGSRVVAR